MITNPDTKMRKPVSKRLVYTLIMVVSLEILLSQEPLVTFSLNAKKTSLLKTSLSVPSQILRSLSVTRLMSS